MRAFKCDHCGQYFDHIGTHKLKGEVCDKKEGFVRYSTVMFIFSSGCLPVGGGGGIGGLPPSPPEYERGGRDLCGDCIEKILLASIQGTKL